MDIVIEELPEGVTCAALTGRLDIDGAAAVDESLRSLADARNKLVVDLSGVSFVASMGLRTLMLCARTLALRGGKMAISRPQPNVGRVLEVSGVDQILTITPSLEAAVAAIR
jgi:anti-anti-sigma factor